MNNVSTRLAALGLAAALLAPIATAIAQTPQATTATPHSKSRRMKKSSKIGAATSPAPSEGATTPNAAAKPVDPTAPTAAADPVNPASSPEPPTPTTQGPPPPPTTPPVNTPQPPQ